MMDKKKAQLSNGAQAFLDYLSVEKGYSPATVRAYGTDIEQFEHWLAEAGGCPDHPETVTRRHIQRFLAELHRAAVKKSSVSRKLSTLRRFFHYLVRKKVLSSNGVILPLEESRRIQNPFCAGILHWRNCCMARDCVFLKRLLWMCFQWTVLPRLCGLWEKARMNDRSPWARRRASHCAAGWKSGPVL